MVERVKAVMIVNGPLEEINFIQDQLLCGADRVGANSRGTVTAEARCVFGKDGGCRGCGATALESAYREMDRRAGGTIVSLRRCSKCPNG